MCDLVSCQVCHYRGSLCVCVLMQVNMYVLMDEVGNVCVSVFILFLPGRSHDDEPRRWQRDFGRSCSQVNTHTHTHTHSNLHNCVVVCMV